MVRAIAFMLLSVITLGVIATPGLALLGVVLLPFLLLGAAGWWIALAVTTHGRPSQAVVRTSRHRFLGPGGPDDSFADVAYDDEFEREPLVAPFAGDPPKRIVLSSEDAHAGERLLGERYRLPCLPPGEQRGGHDRDVGPADAIP
jgi:hypothetical protein